MESLLLVTPWVTMVTVNGIQGASYVESQGGGVIAIVWIFLEFLHLCVYDS